MFQCKLLSIHSNTQNSSLQININSVYILLLKAKRYLDPSSIFHSDIDEAMQRLTQSIEILKFFRELFDHYKEILGDFFPTPEERPPIFWTFHPNSVFNRFNEFLERLNTIQWYAITYTFKNIL